MDKTKQYILMCEKAREIQKEWDEKLVPSFFFDYALDRVTIRIWVPESLQKKIADPITSGRLIISIEEDRPINKWIPEGSNTPVIWLPRQDQLQGMLSDRGYKDFYWLKGCILIMEREKLNYNSHRFKSMEQLWLAFVMKEKYSKQWLTDKQDWVKI